MKNLKLIAIGTAIFLCQNLIGKTNVEATGLAGIKTEAKGLKQIRKCVYLTDNRVALMTFTFDEVFLFYYPYTPSEDLESLIFEHGYNDAEVIKLESPNAKAMQNLSNHSDILVKDQKLTVSANQSLAWVFNNLMYLVLGGIGIYATVLMWKNELISINK